MYKLKSVKLVLLLTSLLILLIVYLLLPRNEDIILDEVNDNDILNRLAKSNDNRKHVFFDLGANIGDSIKYFIDKDPQRKGLKGYAARDLSNKWELYAIEANPFFNKHLDELRDYCEKLGHTLNVYKESAAWIKDEQITFYLDTVNPKYNYWGSSLKKENPDVRNSNYKSVNVTGVDVSRLLSKYNSNDEIVMKIDIEGTEYELLQHLIQQKTLELIDIIAVEWHPASENKDLDKYYKKYFETSKIKFVQWY